MDHAAAEGHACDAVLAPVVTGQVDLAALANLTTTYLDRLRRTKRWHPGAIWPPPPAPLPTSPSATGAAGITSPAGATGPMAPGPRRAARQKSETMRRLQNTLAQAADVLSGLAAFLRTRMLTPGSGPIISRALDIGVDTRDGAPAAGGGAAGPALRRPRGSTVSPLIVTCTTSSPGGQGGATICCCCMSTFTI